MGNCDPYSIIYASSARGKRKAEAPNRCQSGTEIDCRTRDKRQKERKDLQKEKIRSSFIEMNSPKAV